VFSKTVFSIARSTFRKYSVMTIFISSYVWGLFEYCNRQVHRDFLITLYISECMEGRGLEVNSRFSV